MWLAAAKCHRCSRRFSGSNAAATCLRFLGRFKRFAAVDGSDGVLRGFGEWLEEDPIGRFCILNRRNYTRNGHDWNPMPDMELESLRGEGFVFLEGGSRTPPPPPPGYGPELLDESCTPDDLINVTEQTKSSHLRFPTDVLMPISSLRTKIFNLRNLRNLHKM